MSNQVFVRNLSFASTEEQLTALFEGIGPLRRVSLAKEADGRHKGFGFVKFALPEDAAKAVETLQDHELNRRKMKLELAVKKGSEAVSIKKQEVAKLGKNKRDKPASDAVEETIGIIKQAEVTSNPKKNKPSKRESEGTAPPSVPIAAKKVAALDVEDTAVEQMNVPVMPKPPRPMDKARQVLVFGLPEQVRASALQKILVDKEYKKTHAKLITPTSELYTELSLSSLHPAGRSFIVSAGSGPDASAIAELLNGATVQSLGLGAGEADAAANKKRRLKCCLLSEVTEAAARRRSRLIVRNLAFQATRELVAERLDLFGPIVEVELPLVAVKGRGDAATERMNPRGFCFVTFLCAKDARAAVENSILEGEGAGVKKGVKICNRFVAIDFCEAKDRYLSSAKGATATTTDMHTEAADEDHDAGEADDEDHDMEEGEGVDEEGQDDGDGDEEVEEDDDAEEDVDADHAAEEKKSDVSEGCTVFVRDLGAETTTVDLKKAFSPFGFITLALLVKDRDTGMCRGSAFVKFKERRSAAACVTKVGEERAGPPLLINGRPCRVAMAVDKDEAGKLKGSEKLHLDKRHVYLSNEGYISAAATATGKKRKADAPAEGVDVPEEDRVKRERYHSDKKKKLTNPLMFVSSKRLSLRNVSKFLDDASLRSLCSTAVKSGLGKRLVGERDLRALHFSDGNAFPSKEDLSVPAFSVKAVRSAKVMLDMERLKDGKPQSRGFGFVEFSHHAFALACLRELNNNPAYVDFAADGTAGTGDAARGSKKARLIVEFSVENKRKVMILEAREKNNLEKTVVVKQEENAEGTVTATPGKAGDKRKRAADGTEKPSPAADKIAGDGKPELTPAAKKRKQDTRRREKERKRKAKKVEKATRPAAEEKPSWGGFKRLRAQRKGK